jgi:hypothetical protein
LPGRDGQDDVAGGKTCLQHLGIQPNSAFHLKNAALLMPQRRQPPAVAKPRSCSRRIAMIRSFVNRLFFIVQLLLLRPSALFNLGSVCGNHTNAVVVLDVADDRLNARTSLHFAFDLGAAGTWQVTGSSSPELRGFQPLTDHFPKCVRSIALFWPTC